MTEETVVIPVEKFNQMQADLDWLKALEAAGVDQWEGIEYAVDIYQVYKND